ncbi:acyltransferase family protein [Enterococcus diestrammenae]|uniref:Acyltransferase 3 domain-containing protein n=1 Tax=Enterococcus diestrammenae TaxID=1155073 RepID=A0ABV0F012_9ENTE|nr:acyltransferase family protein [Enterococcus diestrammenae]KAF1296635.1 hypothetical protein BAU18_06380 [Enterococcus diestrammenae]
MRNFGLDVLKVISMVSVVILHILGIGGILSATSFFSVDYFGVWILNIFAYSLVNCFGLITGYLFINRVAKKINLLNLWIKVLVYSVGITFLISFGIKEKHTIDIIKAFFPILANRYWYFTSYFVVFLLIPSVNQFILNMSSKSRKSFALLLILLFSVLGSVVLNDGFGLENGYSPIWLIVLYCLGAIIKVNSVEKYFSKFKLLLFVFLLMLLNVFIKFSIDFSTLQIFKDPFGGSFFVKYNSPTILMMSLFLFLLSLKSETTEFLRLNKLVSIFSKHSFSVYLIHANLLVLDHFFLNQFKFLTHRSVVIEIISIISISGAIFLSCILIDYLCDKTIFSRLTNLINRRYKNE